MAPTIKGDIHESEIIDKLPQAEQRVISDKYGIFLFAAYGCALTERQTDRGMYVYTAINFTTGKTEILSRRKRQLANGAFADMAEKISASSVRGGSYLNIDKSPDESENRSDLIDTQQKIFTEILPKHGYALREKQFKLAEHILSVVGQRGITLAESEVGTGKTHAYIVSAVLAKRGRINDFWLRRSNANQSWAESAHSPVIISTSSIALQNAIIKDYIPELSQILLHHGIISRPLTAAVRKGREHYVCEQRINRFNQTTDLHTKALLEPFIGEEAPFDLTDADKLSSYIKRRICVLGKCDDNCPKLKKCRYIRHIKDINNPQIDFQITNHNYFLADTLHRAEGKRPLLPHYQLVIIDEAHKFLQAARSMYGLELTSEGLPELATEIHTFTIGKSGSGINIHRCAKKMGKQSQRLFEKLNDNIPDDSEDDDAERFPAVMDGETGHYLKTIAGITSDLSDAVADSYVPSLYRNRQSKAIWKLKTTAELVSALRKQNQLIYWLEKRIAGENENASLCAIPKDLNERLYHDLWSKRIPIVLTSGTLSASGDFTRTKETMGLDLVPERRLFDTTLPSPFDYENNALLYISENMPFPDNKDKRYISAIADEIECLVFASHGHAVVLFISYNAMGQVHAILKKRNLPFPLFRLERGSAQAIERFKQSGNGILMASGVLWEGIDIPGDALSLLIIVKLPFAVPDPISNYERSLYESMDVYKARCVVPDMLVKLKQGFGRLIRSETDAGVVALLDSRVNERGAYRSRVLSALPCCRVTSSITDVRDFIVSNKNPSYFK